MSAISTEKKNASPFEYVITLNAKNESKQTSSLNVRNYLLNWQKFSLMAKSN